MQMIFSFDTEDYVDPVSNDALLRLAEIHSRYDVTACFGIVGEKARFLQTCGRKDVIEAVARHEVGYHSDHHFILPNTDYEPEYIPEYIEKQPWDQAITRLVYEESRGVRDVAEVFGQQPVTWLRTFGDWAPQYTHTLSRLGLPVYAYGPRFHTQDCAPIWYCDQLAVANPRLMYENNLHRDDLTPQEKLDAHLQAILKHLEDGTPRLGFVTHPTRFITDIWWEEPNWMDQPTAPPRERWRIPPRFSPDKIESLLWIAEGVVKFVSELDGVEPVTFRDFWEKHRDSRCWLSRSEVRELASGLAEAPAYRCLGSETFSPAEMFAAFTFALARSDIQDIPFRHILGPTEEPAATPAGCRVSRPDLLGACHAVEMYLRDRARVPHVVEVGGIPVGPGGFLLAMGRALREPDSEVVDIPAADNLPVPLHANDYDLLGEGTPASYIQQRKGFDFSNTRRMSQLQYWTVKPAVAPA